MTDKDKIKDTVHIRPEVEFYHSFRALNYKAWHAMAEFVDNSVQSWLDHGKKKLVTPNGKETPLIVDITVSKRKITVRDNAGGISHEDFDRALRPGAKPKQVEGSMNIYGMGLKSAAGNFSPLWSVKTTAIGENDLKTVVFDIEKITETGIEDLPIKKEVIAAREHYTHIEMKKVYHEKSIWGKRTGKVKEHLTDIYRNYLRDGTLMLKYNGEFLKAPEVDLLKEEYVHAKELKIEKSPKIEWRKEFEFDVDENPRTGLKRSVSGFAAIVSGKGGHSDTGMPVFVSRRMIKGSGDSKHKPREIYGTGGTYRSLRLFGEIHLSNFDLTHTKDDVEWAGHEEDIYKNIAKIISGNKKKFDKAISKAGVKASDPEIQEHMPLRTQLDNMRTRVTAESQKKMKEEAGKQGAEDTAKTIGANEKALRELEKEKGVDAATKPTKVGNESYKSESYLINLDQGKYAIQIVVGEIPSGRLFQYSKEKRKDKKHGDVLHLKIIIDMNHEFVDKQVDPNQQTNNVLMRMIAAHVLAEVYLESSPEEQILSDSHAIFFNRLLENPFSKIEAGEEE